MRGPNTLFVGQVVHDLPAVASTNEYALTLLSKSNPAEGTVILTGNQTAGRGQIGSAWESEPGKNISLSVIFYPVFLLVKNQFQLNQAVALAVCNLVKKYLPTSEVSIKWPNDIYVGARKIAGILLQNSLINNQIRSTVAGIGINVNQTVFVTHPPNPTSLCLETGENFDLVELRTALFECLEARFLQLKSGNIFPLQQDYLGNLYRFQTPAKFQRSDGEIFEGTITGTDESGRLKMAVQGREMVFDLKEIRFH